MKELSRRDFSLGSAAFALLAACHTALSEEPLVRFGVVTDLHYAKIPDGPYYRGVLSRHYSQSAKKLADCVRFMNGRSLAFMIELGDFKDQSKTKDETLGCLDEIEGVFADFRGPRYHVLGNHDNDCLTKDEFLSHVSNGGQEKALSFYSFGSGNVTFVVLDANFNEKMEPYVPGNWDWRDANVPPDELCWLEKTLAAAAGPVVVFGHQRLDAASAAEDRVKNAAEVRKILERSGKVVAVFTGHDHFGGISMENGILYYTLKAMVHGTKQSELVRYVEVSVGCGDKVCVTGYGDAPNCRT